MATLEPADEMSILAEDKLIMSVLYSTLFTSQIFVKQCETARLSLGWITDDEILMDHHSQFTSEYSRLFLTRCLQVGGLCEVILREA